MNIQQTIHPRYLEYLEAAAQFAELMEEKKNLLEQHYGEPHAMRRIVEIERVEPHYSRVMRDSRYRWGLAGKPTDAPAPRPRMELPPPPANRIVSEWDNSITRRYS